jgi:hypothetical protein
MSEPTAQASSLLDVAVEVERYVQEAGWDRPGRLFALVPTAELLEKEPDIAGELGVHANTAEGLTPVEQDIEDKGRPLEELLARIAWPPAVVGVMAAVERVVLPPEVEGDVPDEPERAVAFAAMHPAREDVRIVAGVLRSGEAHCVLRLRSHDSDDDLMHGYDLVPGLVAALRETLEREDDEDVEAEDWGPDE